MRDIRTLLLSSELRHVAVEVARLFEDLERAGPPDRPARSEECVPPLDVIETETEVEVVLDVPGVRASQIRVLVKNGTVIVAGEKLPSDASTRSEASFHLVERSFGRFARAVQLSGALDAGRAQARLKHGQLRVSIPKVADRRGQEIAVPVAEQDQ